MVEIAKLQGGQGFSCPVSGDAVVGCKLWVVSCRLSVPK
jgi:hypothetical protein